eukprot:gene28269-37299_t
MISRRLFVFEVLRLVQLGANFGDALGDEIVGHRALDRLGQDRGRGRYGRIGSRSPHIGEGLGLRQRDLAFRGLGAAGDEVFHLDLGFRRDPGAVSQRLTFERPNAPSFLPLATEEDRVISTNSFSKAWRMTGWRLGWLVLPPSLTHAVGKLIEFNTSCAPVFVQRGATVALQRTEEVTPALVNHLRNCRDRLVPLLADVPGVSVATPRGGMYAFFHIDGHDDCLTLAKRLVREAGLGLAPGSAFGGEASGWLRWCFASRDVGRLEEGVGRLRGWLKG